MKPLFLIFLFFIGQTSFALSKCNEDLHQLRMDYFIRQINDLMVSDIEQNKLKNFARIIEANVSDDEVQSILLELGIYEIGDLGLNDVSPTTLWVDHLKFQLHLNQAKLKGLITDADIAKHVDRLKSLGKLDEPAGALDSGSSRRRFFSIFNELNQEANRFIVKAKESTVLFSHLANVMDSEGKINLQELAEFPWAKADYDALRASNKEIMENTIFAINDAWEVANRTLTLLEKQKPRFGWSWETSERKQKLLGYSKLTRSMVDKVRQDFDYVLGKIFVVVPSPDVPYRAQALYDTRIQSFHKQTEQIFQIETDLYSRFSQFEAALKN